MKAAVFGAGNMGLDIAQVFAAKGHDVVVRDISDEFIRKGEERLNLLMLDDAIPAGAKLC